MEPYLSSFGSGSDPVGQLITDPDPGGQLITDPDPTWPFLWSLTKLCCQSSTVVSHYGKYYKM